MRSSLLGAVMLLCSWLLFSGSGRAQGIVVDLALQVPNAQIFPVGDLDLTNTGSISPYFTVSLENMQSAAVRIQLRLRILANGIEIASSQSTAFDLPAGFQTMALNSQNLSNGTAMVNGQPVTLRLRDIDYSAIEVLQTAILNTGFVPSGEYRVLMSVLMVPDDGTEILDVVENNTLIITNPTSLELVFPGRSSAESTISEVSTTFPFFQWYTDGAPGAVTFNIFVYEKLPEDQMAQDVLSHTPILEIRNSSQYFFQYPTNSNPELASGDVVGAVRLLENGKTYYWLVESIIPTTASQVKLRSEIFRFKVADLNQTSGNSSQILIFLQQLLGSENQAVLQQLIEGGFEPSGTITLNGNTLEITDLLLLISKVQQGKLQLKKVDAY